MARASLKTRTLRKHHRQRQKKVGRRTHQESTSRHRKVPKPDPQSTRSELRHRRELADAEQARRAREVRDAQPPDPKNWGWSRY